MKATGVGLGMEAGGKAGWRCTDVGRGRMRMGHRRGGKDRQTKGERESLGERKKEEDGV